MIDLIVLLSTLAVHIQPSRVCLYVSRHGIFFQSLNIDALIGSTGIIRMIIVNSLDIFALEIYYRMKKGLMLEITSVGFHAQLYSKFTNLMYDLVLVLEMELFCPCWK